MTRTRAHEVRTGAGFAHEHDVISCALELRRILEPATAKWYLTAPPADTHIAITNDPGLRTGLRLIADAPQHDRTQSAPSPQHRHRTRPYGKPSDDRVELAPANPAPSTYQGA